MDQRQADAQSMTNDGGVEVVVERMWQYCSDIKPVMVKVGETFDCYNAKSDSTDQSNKFNKTRVIIQKQIFTEMGQLNDF